MVPCEVQGRRDEKYSPVRRLRLYASSSLLGLIRTFPPSSSAPHNAKHQQPQTWHSEHARVVCSPSLVECPHLCLSTGSKGTLAVFVLCTQQGTLSCRPVAGLVNVHCIGHNNERKTPAAGQWYGVAHASTSKAQRVDRRIPDLRKGRRTWEGATLWALTFSSQLLNNILSSYNRYPV